MRPWKNLRWLWWIRENHWPNLPTTSGSSVSWGAFRNILVLTPPWCVWAFCSCLFYQGLRCSSISFVPSSCPRKSALTPSPTIVKIPPRGTVLPPLEGSFFMFYWFSWWFMAFTRAMRLRSSKMVPSSSTVTWYPSWISVRKFPWATLKPKRPGASKSPSLMAR